MSYKEFDSGYRGDCLVESEEQALFVDYLRRHYPGSFGRLVVHVANEGKRTYKQAQYKKKMGMSRGACDIIIPGCPAFCMELKRKDRTKSKLYEDQIGYLNKAAINGAYACVAYGFDCALDAFKQWLELLNE